MSINSWMGKRTVAYTHNGTLVRTKDNELFMTYAKIERRLKEAREKNAYNSI